jgi:hypothetical protein
MQIAQGDQASSVVELQYSNNAGLMSKLRWQQHIHTKACGTHTHNMLLLAATD